MITLINCKDITSFTRGDKKMCYNCGCKMPYEDHGDSENITEKFFKQASRTDAMEQGSSVEDAKRNVLELLSEQEDNDELDKPKDEYD